MPDPSRPALGLMAAAVAVTIWAGWIVAVRGAVSGPAGLSPIDLALLRYGGPALLLAPVWLRLGPLPRGVAVWRVAAMSLGWGAPFVLLGAQGLRAADVGLFAALVPGGLPLWVAGLAALFPGSRFRPGARAGLALIALACALALAAATPQARAGAPWLLAASAAWAVYTLAYRGSGLGPVAATAVVSFWSCAMLAPLAVVAGTGLTALSPAAFAAQFALHGVLSGVVSVAAFALAIRELGAARAAAASALVPALAVLGGQVALGETPRALTLVAVLCAAAGVTLVNRAR